MKNIRIKGVILLFIASVLPQLVATQGNSTQDLRYEVKRIYPYISISQQQLAHATTLLDLNPRYQASWINTYKSVEISTVHNGVLKTTFSKNDVLSQEQKGNLSKADADRNINVRVIYLPSNTLKANDVKEINFTVAVNPEAEASYVGGQESLKKYLKDVAIDDIAVSGFDPSSLAAVKFTVSENGHIIDAHIVESSKNTRTDEDLLAAICNMPSWNPAKYQNGISVKQDFVLTVGNLESCLINLINIR